MNIHFKKNLTYSVKLPSIKLKPITSRIQITSQTPRTSRKGAHYPHPKTIDNARQPERH